MCVGFYFNKIPDESNFFHLYLVLLVYYLLQVISCRVTNRKPPLPIYISSCIHVCTHTDVDIHEHTCMCVFPFCLLHLRQKRPASATPLEYCNVLSKQISHLLHILPTPKISPNLCTVVSVPRIHCITHYGNKNTVIGHHHQKLK